MIAFQQDFLDESETQVLKVKVAETVTQGPKVIKAAKVTEDPGA